MTSVCVYLKQPLEAALPDSLRWQDVGQLGVGVGHEQAGGYILSDKLSHSGL